MARWCFAESGSIKPETASGQSMPQIHTLDATLPLPWDILPGPLTVLDFETTGLSPADCSIVEVAAVRLEKGRKPRAFETLLKPHGPMKATRIHGITTAMVADAPKFSDICGLLQELLDGAILTAHNAPFEARFLNGELLRLGGQWGGHRLCTMALARKLHPERKGRGSATLESLADLYGLGNYESHRALADVITTSSLLAYMLEANKSAHDLDSVLQKTIKPVPGTTHWPSSSRGAVALVSRGALVERFPVPQVSEPSVGTEPQNGDRLGDYVLPPPTHRPSASSAPYYDDDDSYLEARQRSERESAMIAICALITFLAVVYTLVTV